MNKVYFYLTVAIVAISILFGVFVRITLVDSSEVGIKFNKLSLTEQGKLDATPVSGYVFYCPITTKVHTYPTYVQRVNYDAFTVNTKDAAIFTMDPTLAYYIDRGRASDVFFKYRKSLEEIQSGYMRTVIYDAYRVTANKYVSDSLMSNRAQFESEVRAMLDKSLNDEGFIVTEFTSQITPPKSLQQMIEAKVIAVQSALKAENEVLQAQANAKIAIAKAEGESKSIKIKADAEAYANKVVAQSLTTLLIQQNAIDKWNGELPQVSGGATPIISLPK